MYILTLDDENNGNIGRGNRQEKTAQWLSLNLLFIVMNLN